MRTPNKNLKKNLLDTNSCGKLPEVEGGGEGVQQVGHGSADVEVAAAEVHDGDVRHPLLRRHAQHHPALQSAAHHNIPPYRETHTVTFQYPVLYLDTSASSIVSSLTLPYIPLAPPFTMSIILMPYHFPASSAPSSVPRLAHQHIPPSLPSPFYTMSIF